MHNLIKNEYVYAVTLVHSREKNLLSRQDIEQLMATATVQEAIRMLTDRGWGSAETDLNSPDMLLAAETKKTWDFMEELADDVSEFNVFRYANDFHNLKAAIKLAYAGYDEEETDRFFIEHGTVPLQAIKQAAKSHDFSTLPENMAQAGKAAYEALAHTGSGQASDIVIDHAALVAVDEAGKKANSSVLERYAQITVDAANIKAAMRAALLQKDKDFLCRVIAPVGTLDTNELIAAASNGKESIYQFLEKTSYAGAVEALKTSMAMFECWCDNQMIEMIRPQRQNYFTIEPMAAFILGRENEIKMVRLVLSAKMNHFSDEAVLERLRMMYV